jgi:hypothetical protein
MHDDVRSLPRGPEQERAINRVIVCWQSAIDFIEHKTPIAAYTNCWYLTLPCEALDAAGVV